MRVSHTSRIPGPDYLFIPATYAAKTTYAVGSTCAPPATCAAEAVYTYESNAAATKYAATAPATTYASTATDYALAHNALPAAASPVYQAAPTCAPKPERVCTRVLFYNTLVKYKKKRNFEKYDCRKYENACKSIWYNYPMYEKECEEYPCPGSKKSA